MNELVNVDHLPTFNYSLLSNEEKLSTLENEKKLTEIFERYQPEVGEVFYNQQQVLARHGNGVFQQWYESLGFNRGNAYRYINKYKFLTNCEELESKEIFLTMPTSLQNEMSKPSADQEINKKVFDGDITTLKEYKELEREKKKLEEKLEESRVKQIELLNKNEELKNKESKEIVKEVIPEHVKIQLSQLKETQNKLKKLQEQNKELNNYDQSKSDIEREINNLIKKKYEQQQAYDEMTILADRARQTQNIETARKRFIRRVEVSTDDLRKQRYSIEELFVDIGDIGEEASRKLIKEAGFLEEMANIFREMADDRNIVNTNYEIIEGEIING